MKLSRANTFLLAAIILVNVTVFVLPFVPLMNEKKRFYLLFELPILSIGLLWYANRKRRRQRRFNELLERDGQTRAERLASFEKARDEWRKAIQAAHTTPVHRTPVARPQQYVQDFRQRPNASFTGQMSQADQLSNDLG